PQEFIQVVSAKQNATRPNVRVDAAARIKAPSAAPSMLRNTLPPLASNELFERPLIVTRYWFPVNRNEQARRARLQRTVEVPNHLCETNRRAACVSEPGAVAMGSSTQVAHGWGRYRSPF